MGERRPAPLLCSECGFVLDPLERAYYGDRCETCERSWANRLNKWLAGAEDEEMDATYGSRTAEGMG